MSSVPCAGKIGSLVNSKLRVALERSPIDLAIAFWDGHILPFSLALNRDTLSAVCVRRS